MATMKKSQSGVRIPKQLIQKGKPDAKNSGLISDTISTNKKRSTPIHEGFKSFNDPTAKRSTRKYKTGGSLGMKSVKAGFDKNPGVTRADIITAATKKAKNGKPVKKAAIGALLPLAMKAAPMVAGMLGGKGKGGGGGGLGGILGGLLGGKNGKTIKKSRSGSSIKKAQDGGQMDRILSKPSPLSTPKEKPVPTPPPAFPKKFSKPSKASKPSKPMMKSGGKMKTCKGGC
jgi:hypothetical protein